MFGIAFGLKFLNQGGALVHIYRDGSVLVSHGGIEMGQGLYTKMIQIASKCLNIPVTKIHTSQSSTTQGTSLSIMLKRYDSYRMNHIDESSTTNHRIIPVRFPKFMNFFLEIFKYQSSTEVSSQGNQ